MAISAEKMKEIMENAAKMAGVDDVGELSDGYHTFNSLYRQRCILFAALVNLFPASAWKSRKHEDGKPCFGGGWFVVCIDTPDGPYSYHYEDKDWDLFHCEELERARPFDGHTDKDVGRLLSLGISGTTTNFSTVAETNALLDFPETLDMCLMRIVSYMCRTLGIDSETDRDQIEKEVRREAHRQIQEKGPSVLGDHDKWWDHWLGRAPSLTRIDVNLIRRPPEVSVTVKFTPGSRRKSIK